MNKSDISVTVSQSWFMHGAVYKIAGGTEAMIPFPISQAVQVFQHALKARRSFK